MSKRWRKKIFLRKAKKFFLSPIRGKYLYVHTHTRTHAHTLIPPPPLPLSSFISLNTKMFHTIRLHIFLLFLLESNAFIPFLILFRYPSGLIRSPERGLSRLFSFLIFFPFFHFFVLVPVVAVLIPPCRGDGLHWSVFLLFPFFFFFLFQIANLDTKRKKHGE